MKVQHRAHPDRVLDVGEDFLKWNPEWQPSWKLVPIQKYNPRPRAKTTAEIWRTVASVLSIGLQFVVLLKVFKVI